jgi:hypothetical protein
MRVITLAMFLVLMLTFPAQAQEKVASVNSVSGQVDLLRSETKLTAVPGLDLFQGDTLITGLESTMGMTFLDGTRVSLGPSSEIQVQEYLFQPSHRIFSFDMYMKKGTAVYSSGMIEKMSPDKVIFKTPTTTVGVRGTRFLVKVN